MKKMITVGMITILATIGLTGCDWSQSAEPVVAEPFVYENIPYEFSLTFPISWGEVKDKEDEIALIIGSEDNEKSMRLYVVGKGMQYEGDDGAFVGSTENYEIYRSSLQREIAVKGSLSEKTTDLEAMEAEYEKIIETFKALEPSAEIVDTTDYEYNNKTGEISDVKDGTVLYKNPNSPNTNLDILGLEGKKLIVLEIDSENSPGPGFVHEVWFSEFSAKNIYYLDLSDTSKGLQTYSVPKWKKLQEQKLLEEFVKTL